MLPNSLITDVSSILRDVAAEHVMPLWQKLDAEHIMTKGGKSIVTAADIAAEKALADRLAALLDQPVIVGEELAEENPAVLEHLAEEHAIWIIDPIDGTRSYAAGSKDFGVMVALKYKGQLTHGWLYRPAHHSLMVAEAGAGASLDGKTVRLPQAPTLMDMNVCLSTRFWPRAIREPLEAAYNDFPPPCEQVNAITTFSSLASGTVHALLDPARRPWDVAAGVVMYTAMGGHVRHLDGRPYIAAPTPAPVLYAPDETTWNELAARAKKILPSF